MINDKEFLQFQDGVFKPYFEKYIEYKRGTGEKVTHSTLLRLKDLNALLNQYGTLEISTQMIEEILSPKADISDHVRRERTSHLRQFSQFMRTIGISSCPVQKKYAKFTPSQFKPYIFSSEEIKQLLHATDHLPKGIRCNNHLDVYPVLIRILIGTGMRIGEVIRLQNKDVDIEQGIIRAINGKNGVSRYIPVSDSLLDILKVYCLRKENNQSDIPFFISPYTGTEYSYSAMKYMFQKICELASIRRSNGRLPNIHSLRHTFCTKSLEKMLEGGMNEYTAVPILAAYLGHVNLKDTEKYIHFTNISYEKFVAEEAFMKNIVPEVDIDE
jgi:integrase